jgi:hypothetical protein
MLPDLEKPTKKWAFAHSHGSSFLSYCSVFGEKRPKHEWPRRNTGGHGEGNKQVTGVRHGATIVLRDDFGMLF